MLSITLLPDDTVQAVELSVGASGTARARLEFVIAEDDETLVNKFVEGSLRWGDSSAPIVFEPVKSQNHQVLSTTFVPGLYVARIAAKNFREVDPEHPNAPDRQLRVVTFNVTGPAVPVESRGAVFGPILPDEDRHPNPSQWNFDVGKDLAILMSSLQMLLMTKRGERVMEPDYGTSLQVLLFEPMTAELQTRVNEEIATAVAKWEPRVNFDGANIARRDARSMQVVAGFTSKLNNQTFQLNLSFVK